MMCKYGHGQMEHEPDCLYCDCEQYEPAPAPQEPAHDGPLTCGMCKLPIHPGETGLRYFGWFTAHSEHRCLELLQMQLVSAEERARQNEDYLDAIAQALHPHKPGEGWTYLPDQLAGMVTELQERARKVQEDTERLDWLDKQNYNGAMEMYLGGPWRFIDGITRGWWKIDGRPELGKHEHVREAIDAARKESQS